MGPLKGLKIIEMEGLAPGPYTAMLLADMGADVLRIARPIPMEANVDVSTNFLNRNRISIPIDVKSESGKSALMDLVSNADALIEGYRPGVMEKLGLGPEACFSRNSRLVYGRITGWGQNGQLAQAAGHDLNYIALTGALHSMGSREGPPPVPLNLLGDFAGGGMLLAFGILAAIIEARHSGEGQVVDAAMVDGVSSMMTYIHSLKANSLWSDERGENILDGSAPYYAVYETFDSKYISIAAAEPKFYKKMLELTGLSDTELPRQNDRGSWPLLRDQLAKTFRSKTQAEWVAIMEGTDSCFAPVLSIPDAIEHPHNKAREAFINVDGHLQPAPAPRFMRTPAAAPTAEISLAEQSDLVLDESWGVSPEALQDLINLSTLQPSK
jgi:alpha-methylacyl-CoA racemase